MTPQWEKPANLKLEKLTAETKTLNKNKQITLITQRKSPNVKRFIGKKSSFRNGLIIKLIKVITKPAKIIVSNPPTILNPG